MASPAGRLKLADQRGVRNEFLEADIDPQTGGIKALRDHRTRVNRLSQQLVFNPGSTMKATKVEVVSAGPALGEVVAEGTVNDEQGQVLAHFKQRLRAWLGRPILELRIELTPTQPLKGYPWHFYYGSRFAWADERATLLRGVNGTGYVTSHSHPESPDYLDLRMGRQGTVIFPQGLPFHQRHGGRMLDVILVPEGETARVFDLALGLDRDYPMHAALGLTTPPVVVPTTKGPPHVGASGWLFHLDSANVALLNMRPAPNGADGVIGYFLECGGHTVQSELRCVRDPVRATTCDPNGESRLDLNPYGDIVSFEVMQGDLVPVRVDFS
jgi:hypothetical protein